MKKAMVTVVVPIYNVECYLDRCMQSIVNQTYNNLEIILVDDGSKDSCPQLCDEWANKDSRVKVIHKKNAGLGMARNTGMENATGEYICFFDSDDYVELDTIEKAYNLAKEYDADIVTYGYSVVNKMGIVEKTYIPNVEQLVFEGKDILNKVLPDMIAPNEQSGEVTNLWMSMCGALFSMQLINRTGWRSASEREIISEDLYSLLKLYYHVNKVIILKEAKYYYCQNSTSLTHTYRSDRFEKIKYFYDECIELSNKLNYNTIIKERLTYAYLSFTISAMKMIVSSINDTKEKIANIKKIVCDEHLQNALASYKPEKTSKTRKLLLFVIKNKWYRMSYFFVKLKTG